MSMYGLPTIVVHLLRTMEAHRDFLKWNISHSSSKISLTLTWTFAKHKEGIFQRLQKTVKSLRVGGSGGIGGSSGMGGSGSNMPERPDQLLTRSYSFCTPARHIRSSASSQQSLPRSKTCDGHVQPVSPVRPFTSTDIASPHWSGLSRAQRVKAWASSRSSWPGTPVHSHRTPTPLTSTPMTSTPIRNSPAHSTSPVHSEFSHTLNWPSSARISYRTDEEWDENLRESFDIVQKRTRKKLEMLKQDFDETVKDWSKHNDQRHQHPHQTTSRTNLMSPAPRTAGSSAESLDSDLTTNGSSSIQGTSATVQQCLQTCDKILYKHSTLIM